MNNKFYDTDNLIVTRAQIQRCPRLMTPPHYPKYAALHILEKVYWLKKYATAIPPAIIKITSQPNILPPFFSRYIYIITIQKDIKKCKEPKNLVFLRNTTVKKYFIFLLKWKRQNKWRLNLLWGLDMNLGPSGYEPDECIVFSITMFRTLK